jgi:hypothetical protein
METLTASQSPFLPVPPVALPRLYLPPSISRQLPLHHICHMPVTAFFHMSGEHCQTVDVGPGEAWLGSVLRRQGFEVNAG